MNLAEPIVLDGVLWSPNTLEIRDILTVGRKVKYTSERLQKSLNLIVSSFIGDKCSFWGEDDNKGYTVKIEDIIIENLSLR